MQQLKYEGCTQFRQRIAASLLSGKALKIVNIRNDHEHPGLHDFEANFLRLIDKLTDGSSIEINETGTSLLFRPGLVIGGQISHECGVGRAIGWFIEGTTNDAVDLSVDVLRAVTLPLLWHFGIVGPELKVARRAAAPSGGGIVTFTCPIVRELKPLHLMDMGLIKKVRGVAFCTKISPTIVTRVVETARGALNEFLPDVFITTDHYKGVQKGGESPGYSLSLVAESTTGVMLSVERTACKEGGELPEQIGEEGALYLLEEIQRGGCVDSTHQSLFLQLMAVCPEDVCKVRFGAQLTSQSIGTLALLRDAFGVVFKIRKDVGTEEGSSSSSSRDRRASRGTSEDDLLPSPTVILTCLGIGYKNMSRKIK